MLIPSTDIEASQKAVEIAGKNPGVYAAVGIHPSDVDNYSDDILDQLEMLAQSSPKVMAIGEIGLDYYWIFKTCGGNKDQKIARDEAFNVQKKFFVAQLDMAKKLDKTVIIHCRQAKKHIISVLDEHWHETFRNKMVFHCCEPEAELLMYARSKEIYIGIDGDVTYNKDKQDFIKLVPLDRLVLETDSPFMTPDPVRKTVKFPNEPANMKYIAQCVAELKGVIVDEVIEQTTVNAKNLFRIV